MPYDQESEALRLEPHQIWAMLHARHQRIIDPLPAIELTALPIPKINASMRRRIQLLWPDKILYQGASLFEQMVFLHDLAAPLMPTLYGEEDLHIQPAYLGYEAATDTFFGVAEVWLEPMRYVLLTFRIWENGAHEVLSVKKLRGEFYGRVVGKRQYDRLHQRHPTLLQLRAW